MKPTFSGLKAPGSPIADESRVDDTSELEVEKLTTTTVQEAGRGRSRQGEQGDR
jgi:hypothetical protein